MNKNSFRDKRVGELLRHEIARIIQQDIKDEQVKSTVITEVTVTKDLSIARVYYSSYLEMDLMELKSSLEKAAYTIVSILRKSVQLRRIPNLEFYPDNTLDQAVKIERLIREISSEQ